MRFHRPKVPVVYFARLQSGLIKIGRTCDLAARMHEIRWLFRQRLRLLGVMPGTHKTERETHERFHRLAQGNELFRASPALLEFIEANTSVPEHWYDYSEWVTSGAAASVLSCSQRQIRQLAKAGKIRRRKGVVHRAYSLEDIERLVEKEPS